MKAANGYGGIVKLSGKRRRRYTIRVTERYYIDKKAGKKKDFKIIGYTKAKKEAITILHKYHENEDFDINYTFLEVYKLWVKEELTGLSKSYINATHAAYQAFQPIHDKDLHY